MPRSKSNEAATTDVLLGLGSNLGRPLENLHRAVRALTSLGEIAAVSSLYRTEPVGFIEQDDFLNAVLLLRTSLGPEELLKELCEIENQAGRRRLIANGPRSLDLDILYYGEQVIERDGLAIPHPRLAERRFVLEPLAEIRPGQRDPANGLVAAEMLARLAGDERVERLNEPSWPPATAP
jgi:2-amino-4-hydroxy-6-hydroxymethyldihydropteridine diphosphokinase